MKILATAIASIAIFTGISTNAEAREYCGDRHSPSVYISGRASCGTPIYTERYLIRIDHHGHPIWGYRFLPVSYHSRVDTGYGRGYDRRYDRRDHCDESVRRFRDSQRSIDARHREFIRGVYR
jgi:hypothetical protein